MEAQLPWMVVWVFELEMQGGRGFMNHRFGTVERHHHDQQRGAKAVALLVLDIDGTVRQGKDDALGRFVNTASDVVVFPEAIQRMRVWKAFGGRIIGVSNQGGIALGHLTIRTCLEAMVETQKQTGGLFDKIAFCQHHPEAKDPEFAVCWCRKPAPGLVLEAALDLASYTGEMYPPHMALFVGDRPEDEECARRINMPFMWAKEWRETGYRSKEGK
jgi:D-glycero-D-manno-heptose 1,7-bisphosphate phosphatase